VSLDLSIPGDWRSWDDASKERLAARLRAETLILGKVQTYCDDPTPSAMAQRWLGDRWHHRAYHDVLDQLALDLEAGVVDRATVSMAPQVGKSTWVNWLVAWTLARHPTDPIIRMSYAAELATTHARVVQGFVEDHGSAYGLLPKRGDWAQHNWHTLSGAGLRSGGMLTGVAGFPAARMVIDDPIGGRALADSKVIRDKTYDEYSANLLSRLRPGGWLLIVNTRWHDDDLNARVIKLEGTEATGGRWREINLPAIAWEADDPLGREIGEPLPHPWIEPDDTAAALKHWEEKRRTSTVRDWYSLYQGDPRPAEGALLTDDQVKAATYDGDIDFGQVKTGVAIDPNGGGRDVAGVIGGCQLDDGTVVWTHDRSGNMGSDGWSVAACQLAHEIDAGVIVYEHNYGGDQAKLILRTVWQQLSDEAAGIAAAEAVASGKDPKAAVSAADWGPCPRIEAVHAKKGKRVRAEPIAAQVIFGKVRFWGLNVLDLGSEWQTWQEDSNESPGRIDASCYLAYKWLKIPGAEAVVSNIADKPLQPTGRTRQAQRRFTRAAPGVRTAQRR
jgi:hypothetical protein